MPASVYLSPPHRLLPVGRGDIYEFVPVHWLNPPVYILRNWQTDTADVFQTKMAADAFRVSSRDNKEYIITEGKTRFVIVFSHDAEIRKERAYLLVVPIYTVNPQTDDPFFIENLRHYRIYNAFYLPPEPALGISESYADFRRLQPLHRDFLEPEKRCARLSPTAMQAVLVQFSKFLTRS